MCPSDLQGPLIQGTVLALDFMAGASLWAEVLGTREDGTVLLQVVGSWVLGTGEHLWTQRESDITFSGAPKSDRETRVGVGTFFLRRRKA